MLSGGEVLDVARDVIAFHLKQQVDDHEYEMARFLLCLMEEMEAATEARDAEVRAGWPRKTGRGGERGNGGNGGDAGHVPGAGEDGGDAGEVSGVRGGVEPVAAGDKAF